MSRDAEPFSSLSISRPPLSVVEEVVKELSADPYQQTFGDIVISREGKLLNKVLEYHNIGKDIVESYEEFIDNIIQIMTGRELIFPSQGIKISFSAEIQILDITPYQAREKDQTYALIIGLTIILTKDSTVTQQKVDLPKIPIMAGSKYDYSIRKKLSTRQILDIGECVDDPVGYFPSVKGNEYVFINQDKLRYNKDFCYFGDFGFINQMTSEGDFGVTKSMTLFEDKQGVYLMNLQFIGKKLTEGGINVLILLKILLEKSVDVGTLIESILAHCHSAEIKKRVRNKLHATKVHYMQIFLSEEDEGNKEYKYLAKVKPPPSDIKTNNEIKEYYDKSIMEDLFYQYGAHGTTEDEKRRMKMNKFVHLCLMVAKTAEVSIGYRKQDNRDGWGHKRVVTAGVKMKQLFNSYWRDKIKSITGLVTKDGKFISEKTLANLFRGENKKTEIFEESFVNTWGATHRAQLQKEKYTDQLKRESKLSPYAQINRISTPSAKENTNIDPLKVESSQYGFIDPVDTPDGKESCGKVKNKSITAWISISRRQEQYLVLTYIRDKLSTTKDANTPDYLIVNGQLFGFCQGSVVYNILRDKRRSGSLHFDVMICYVKKDNTVYVHSDSGRLLRPLLIVNEKTGKLVIDEIGGWNLSFDELLRNGSIEYIDAFEQEHIILASSVSQLHEIDRKIEALRQLESLKSEYLTTKKDYYVIYGDQITDNIEEYLLKIKSSIKDRNDQITKLNGERNSLEIKAKLMSDKFNLDLEYLKNIEVQLQQGKKPSNLEGIVNKILLYKLDTLPETPTVDDTTKVIDILRLEMKSLSNTFTHEMLAIKKRISKIQTQKETLIKEIDGLQKELGILPLKEESQFDVQILRLKTIIKDMNKGYTHCEIHPAAIFSIAASLIPAIERNQAVRAGFQCGQSKQALGIYHANMHYRFDTSTKALAYPSRPLFETQFGRLLGLNKYSPGQMIILAVMPMLGFNQEDSIIVNRASIERGLFNMWVFKGVDTNILTQNGESLLTDLSLIKSSKSKTVYRHLDKNGIARPESVIKEGDCLIGKIKKIGSEYKDISIYATADYDNMIVDRYLNTGVDTLGKITIKVKLRQYRYPIQGDKFASRIAQKSTVGLTLNEEDMPFGWFGDKKVHIDAIINTHAFPSRMTLSHLIEMFLGKQVLMTGTRINATAFETLDFETFQRILTDYGYNANGESVLYSGITGEQLKGNIFTGPILYQALKHHAKDKIQMRQRGTYDSKSHQPKGGRKKGQAGKIGEMERDNIISHGAAGLLQETHCISSTKFSHVICATCGISGTVGFVKDRYECSKCGDKAKIVVCDIPYGRIRMEQLLNVLGISQQYGVKLKERHKL